MDNVISMELVNTEIPNLVNTFSVRKGNYQFKVTIMHHKSALDVNSAAAHHK